MKKVISILSVMFLLFTGFAQAEQDKEAVEVCEETAKNEGMSAEQAKEYIDQCVKDIAEDEKREKMESK